MLTEEQVKEIKEQLSKQIEKFPAQQRETAKQQIGIASFDPNHSNDH